MAAITDLYRYPVKGLSPEPLTAMSLSAAHGLPFDRVYALALGTTAFDPERPEPLDKGAFLMLRNNEALAALRTRVDPDTHRLTIERAAHPSFSADLSTPEGRADTEAYFAAYLGAATKGPPRVVRADGHKFTDASVLSPVMMRAVSVINLASVRVLEAATGRTLDPLRFRGNIHLEGLEPWVELNWVDRPVRIGGVRFRGLARTPRCAAVNVNSVTAERDANLPRAIRQHFGHVDLGVYLEVLNDGDLQIGDVVTV
ncbi:MOSC domain-containing protein [Methylobacterium sp. Leaf117]|uniref:MOSC domain-containing protein n=1 Tax=Methylobacterium sp. Leaf117 TaxID=1736260 RepID=UPI0006F86C74|nr:MOSC domain-containing protein [Methylobacterium sp. Leaf117]KQP92106.1 sulfurase [Methylobacterium sp. Leaf117]